MNAWSLLDVLDQSQPVDDVARLDRLDRHAFGRHGRVEPVRPQREAQPQVVDELVHLGECRCVVQPAFERVAEQLGEALSLPHPAQHVERLAHPLRRQVDGHRVRAPSARRWRGSALRSTDAVTAWLRLGASRCPPLAGSRCNGGPSAKAVARSSGSSTGTGSARLGRTSSSQP